MNNDLISREWIRKTVEEYRLKQAYDAGEEMRNTMVDWIEEDIDNAPTVELNDKSLEIARKSIELGRSVGKLEGKLERPQGEWIYGEDDCGQDGWFCSECNFFVPWYYQYYEKDINFIREYKACPHCLAEMVTYTGKDRDTKCGADMRKPNCVICDHFGKCEGCEKGEEE